jgi:hypothetical protein
MIWQITIGVLAGVGSIPIFLCYAFRERVSETGRSVLMGFLMIYLWGVGYFSIEWILAVNLLNFSITALSSIVVISLIYAIYKKLQ